jgi:hypothetical protein
MTYGSLSVLHYDCGHFLGKMDLNFKLLASSFSSQSWTGVMWCLEKL